MRTTKGSTGGVNLEALVVMSIAEAAAIAKSAYMTVEDEEQPTTAFFNTSSSNEDEKLKLRIRVRSPEVR